MLRSIVHKAVTVSCNPHLISRKLFYARDIASAKKYIEKAGLSRLLVQGFSDEYGFQPFDLYNIHRLIRRRRPLTVVEFGTGWSTLTIAHALHQNYLDDSRNHPMLYTTDASDRWLENVKGKIPSDLKEFVDLRYSKTDASLYEGELCHFYREIPNVSPDFLYLDGPSTADVGESVHGVKFVKEDGRGRGPISGDPLIYESSLRMAKGRNFFMLVDGRWTNVQFLLRHLKRRYRFRRNRVHSFSTFELVERS